MNNFTLFLVVANTKSLPQKSSHLTPTLLSPLMYDHSIRSGGAVLSLQYLVLCILVDVGRFTTTHYDCFMLHRTQLYGQRAAQ